MAGTHGFHESFHDEAPATGSDRSFCFFFAALSAAAAFYFREHNTASIALACAGAALLLAGLTRPALVAPLNRAWGKFGLILARITNPVVLLALYACVIVPVGLLAQLAAKLRKQPQTHTYWITRTPPTPASMADQF